MADEQRDLEAEMRATADALAEALRPAIRAMNAWIEAFGRAAQAWLEQNRLAIEALGELARDPRVRAYIEARERGELPPPRRRRPCLCLCGRTHPGETGVCDGNAVTTRHYETELLGPVDVPLCAPCGAAQFLTEMADQ